MDYKELAKSLLCNGSGVGEDTNGCVNKKCKHCRDQRRQRENRYSQR